MRSLHSLTKLVTEVGIDQSISASCTSKFDTMSLIYSKARHCKFIFREDLAQLPTNSNNMFDTVIEERKANILSSLHQCQNVMCFFKDLG